MTYRLGHQQPKQQKDAAVQFGAATGRKRRFSFVTLAALALGASILSACNNGGGKGSMSGGGSGSGGGPAVNITGNWKIAFAASNSPAPIGSMAGYLYQSGQGSQLFTTAALQAQTSGCFQDASTVPMYGETNGSSVTLASFAIESQMLSIDVQANASGNQFTGSYSIAGGCAGGAKGTVAGTEYAPLTGSYSGTVPGSSPTVGVSLTLSQDAGGTGLGTFPLSGSAGFSGISCFSQGTLAAINGSVIGDSVNMNFTTNDTQGAQVQMTGTLDPAAKTLTLSSIQINGGACGGSLGSATLVRLM